MASSWANALPKVTVPTGTMPKSVTIVLPYYCNAQFLQEQAKVWRSYPNTICPFVSLVLVDDGSPIPAVLPKDLPFAASLYRITVDVAWNWLAARNLGADRARDGWLLMTDMDHVVLPETAASLVWGQHDPKVIYAFSRREHTGEVIQPHSASFFLTRKLFWTIGGYDERLSGHYGTDGDFRRRAAAYAKIRVLPNLMIRHERVGDSSTTNYQRKLPSDAAAVAGIVAARGKDWRPKVLSFAYEAVTC